MDDEVRGRFRDRKATPTLALDGLRPRPPTVETEDGDAIRDEFGGGLLHLSSSIRIQRLWLGATRKVSSAKECRLRIGHNVTWWRCEDIPWKGLEGQSQVCFI